MPASALRLRSYLDRGPQVGWADFFGDTAFLAQTDFAAPQASDPQASGTQASDWTGAELFRLGVMRLGALRQRGEWRGALELLRALERGAEQAKPNDGHLLHIEGLRTALVSGQDHATLRYALKVLEPPPGLDTWTQSYNHLALAHLHFALWNDDEAEQELRAARLKGELPPHPFAFLMSPTDQRLTERWMVALRRGGQLAELLPELAAQEREAAELWPGQLVAGHAPQRRHAREKHKQRQHDGRAQQCHATGGAQRQRQRRQPVQMLAHRQSQHPDQQRGRGRVHPARLLQVDQCPLPRDLHLYRNHYA